MYCYCSCKGIALGVMGWCSSLFSRKGGLLMTGATGEPSFLPEPSFYEPVKIWGRAQQTLHWVEEMSLKHGRDESHNAVHSREVLFWSTELIRLLPRRLERDKKDVIFQTSLLHDFLDSKYTLHTLEVQDHLLSLGYSVPLIEVMMNIMNTMSYSKVFIQSTSSVHFPSWLVKSPYQHAFHITREADLLASYNIARIIYFQIDKNPSSTPQQIRDFACALFEKRMRFLVQHNLFYFPSSKELARAVCTVAEFKLRLLQNSSAWEESFLPSLDILKIVNYLEDGLLESAVLSSCL